MADLDRRLSWRHAQAEYANKSLEEAIALMNSSGLLVGTPELLIERIKTYADAGVEELMMQWFDTHDLDGLHTFAGSVLPHI